MAKAAVAALHQAARKPKSRLKELGFNSFIKIKDFIINQKKNKVKIGSKSSSALERIRDRRSVKDEIKAPLTTGEDIFKKSKLNPNYKLAQKLRDFLNAHHGGVKTDTLVAKFDGNIKNSAVFKAVLKQIATLNKVTHRWTLREQFRD